MTCKLLQKRSGKTTDCSKHLWHIAIEKDIFSELNRCIFQISRKYIKLVTPEILFILVLCNFNFYDKITWLPLQQYNPPSHQNKNSGPSPSKDFSKIFNLPQAGGEGRRGACHAASHKIQILLLWCLKMF